MQRRSFATDGSIPTRSLPTCGRVARSGTAGSSPRPCSRRFGGEWRPQDAAEALADLYGCYAREHHKTRYADKTPQHVVHIDLLARSFPQARFVHLVRDGRNVVSSLLDYPHGPKRFVDGVEYWRYRVSAGRRSGVRLGPDRYLEIRYEALVDDPEAVLRDLCGFIELPYDARMLGVPRAGRGAARGARRSHPPPEHLAPTDAGHPRLADHDARPSGPAVRAARRRAARRARLRAIGQHAIDLGARRGRARANAQPCADARGGCAAPRAAGWCVSAAWFGLSGTPRATAAPRTHG